MVKHWLNQLEVLVKYPLIFLNIYVRDANSKRNRAYYMQKYSKERKSRFRHKMIVGQKKKKQKCRMLKIYKKDRNLNLKWKPLLDLQTKTQHLYALFGTDVFMQRLFIYSINKNTIVISLTISTFVTIWVLFAKLASLHFKKEGNLFTLFPIS